MEEDIDYSTLTKGQRKRLKKEQRKQEKEREITERKKKRTIKKIKKYGIMLLILLVVIAFFYLKSIPPKNAPIIDITPDFHNFGAVSQAAGVVSTTLTIKNNGVSDLILNKMDTSCGCTSAAIVYKGIEGPRFSMAMHGTNPKDWEQVIPPGESVQLKVYYNPNVHKDMRGPVTRSVSIYSNDPRSRIKEVQINANQVD